MSWYTPDDKGVSWADKYPDRVPEEPDLEAGSEFLLTAFMEMSAKRLSGMSGAEALTYSEVYAYINTTQTPLRPQEVKAIMLMDSAWMQAVRDVRDRMKPDKESK